jgi:hypothetical protein
MAVASIIVMYGRPANWAIISACDGIRYMSGMTAAFNVTKINNSSALHLAGFNRAINHDMPLFQPSI